MIPLNDKFYFGRHDALRTAALVIGAIVVFCLLFGLALYFVAGVNAEVHG